MKKQENDETTPLKNEEGVKPGDQFKYPASEDIYNNEEEIQDMDVDDLTQKKAPNMPADAMNEKSFKDDVSGDDLDVPGAELDDEAEMNGNEDEENNDYSLGGDKHDN